LLTEIAGEYFKASRYVHQINIEKPIERPRAHLTGRWGRLKRGKSMNRIRNTVVMLAAAGMLSMGATQLVQAQTVRTAAGDSSRNGTCSNADVAGAWGWTETGTVIPSTGAVPFAFVARITLDADGNLTATANSDGSITNVTLKGTGTVNSDCTSTLTVGIYESGTLLRTATVAFVYVDNAQEGRGITTSIVLAAGTSVPSVLTINARKLFHGSLREQ
jgi:hypothetical protein